MTAPMPNGIIRPTTEVLWPTANLRRNIRLMRSAIGPNAAAGQVLRDHLAPERRAGRLTARRLAGELPDEFLPAVAEHHRHHESPRSFGLDDRDAVDLADRLREERGGFEESRGFDAREHERRADTDDRDRGGGPDESSSRRDGGQVPALEDPDDLRGTGIGTATPDAADVREHDRSLHREQRVDAAGEGRIHPVARLRSLARDDLGANFGLVSHASTVRRYFTP